MNDTHINRPADGSASNVDKKSLIHDVVALSQALIARASVTPEDAGCQSLLAESMAPFGFEVHWLRQNDVSNVVISHRGNVDTGVDGYVPHLMFLGHTDVVPPGDSAAWDTDPFTPVITDGYLYGRGAADMKAAVAAMAVAMVRFVTTYPDYAGRLSLLLTSDEEGPAIDGVRVVAPQLQAMGLLPDYCLVGEPSCHTQLGDTVRIGRRGSIHGRWLWRGEQGHTAYTHPADNPLHRAMQALAAITAIEWDAGNEEFPSTRLNLVRVLSDSGANNITPSQVEAGFNIRNSPLSPAADLHQHLQQVLQQMNAVPDQFDWSVSGDPFMTAGDHFRGAVLDAIREHTGIEADANTGGGTSDGRFLAPLGVEVVELGLVNQTIHKVNECAAVADIESLADIYTTLCQRIFT